MDVPRLMAGVALTHMRSNIDPGYAGLEVELILITPPPRAASIATLEGRTACLMDGLSDRSRGISGGQEIGMEVAGRSR